jgi:hypothetical protein
MISAFAVLFSCSRVIVGFTPDAAVHKRMLPSAMCPTTPAKVRTSGVGLNA